MASQSYRNIIAALSLCESCALSIHNSNGKVPQASRLLSEVVEQLKNAAREAREHWPAELTKKDADKIAEGMKKADFENPSLDTSQTQCTIYYTSLALGLLDELLRHIQDTLKREHLERVERAIWHLHKYFDSNLDRFAIYEHASRAVSIWLECLNG